MKTLTANEIKEYVTQYIYENILETRRAVQKVFMEYRRFVRGLHDMYDKLKAKETRRWGHATAANALEQSLLTQTFLQWDGADPPKEFGLKFALKDFLELNEPVSINENLGELATALMEAAAYKKQLKVMGRT
jgi:hypothetical protein